MWPQELKIVLHEDSSGQNPAPIHIAIVRLQDAPYDENWGAYYAETTESQQARGGLQMYEVWIPLPTWPTITQVKPPTMVS